MLNIVYIINDEFLEKANKVFNPRNSMHISKNDGKFDNNTSHKRDTIINFCTFMKLGKEYQTEEELNRKKELIEKRNKKILNGEL